VLAFRVNAESCSFNTGVDISDGTVFKDNSIFKDGVRFPPKYVYKRNVSGEIRTFGCICKLKNCFRKCCPLNYVMYNKNCTEMPESDIIVNEGINLNFFDSYKKKIEASKNSAWSLVYGRPCDAVYMETRKWFIQEVSLETMLNV
jgi:hypothetical protein